MLAGKVSVYFLQQLPGIDDEEKSEQLIKYGVLEKDLKDKLLKGEEPETTIHMIS